MSHGSNEMLKKFLKENNSKEFKQNAPNLPDDITELMETLNDEEKKKAVDWCREIGIYLVHKLFIFVTKTESLLFLQNNLELYKTNHLCDEKERTWLHIAVRYDRDVKILSFLVNEIQIDIRWTDSNKFTALHLACQKSNYIPGELEILIKESNQLVARSFDDVTPLELACADMRKLKDLKRNRIVNINELLQHIDKVSFGLPETEDFYFNDKISTKRMWLNLLQKNDKHILSYYMKKDPKFYLKYYMTVAEMTEIVDLSLENGHGVLTYIKNKYLENNVSMGEIFVSLTGLNLEKIQSNDENETTYVYYRSALFMTLITGRFELVPTLLAYCQFDLISYGLMTCLICKKLVVIKEFPEQVIVDIRKLKDCCEKYSVAVLNRTVIRDLTPGKTIISGFLNKTDKLVGQNILDIAHLGKCSKFLGLPTCQETFTKQWNTRNRQCPALKFYLHSLFHCIFLGLLSYVLVYDFYAKATAIEIICYAYGLGYFFEEVRQIYINYKEDGFNSSYLEEASNYIDIGSIFTLILSGTLRIFLPIKTYPNQGDEGLFLESKDFNLFFIRLILCISLILYYMRIIYFGSIFEQLGPKLKMMARMIIQDLMPLIFIFAVFIAAFGIAFQSLMFPNSFYPIKGNSTFEKKSIYVILRALIRRSTYTIFDTHYPFEELEHDEGGYVVNSEGKIAVYFLLIIYMVVVNIMLTNLLIALFSNTVTVIIQKSRDSWKANRYKDIKEYFDRSLFPPPLNVAEILIEIIVKVYRKKQLVKMKDLTLNEEEMQNFENANETQKTQFISFKIIQAFTLKDCRYKLILNENDKEYENRIEIKCIKKGIESIDKNLKEHLKKKS